jgi:hypothetical protein
VGEKTKLYKTKPTRQPADSTGPELYFRKKPGFTKRSRQAKAPVAPFTKRSRQAKAWMRLIRQASLLSPHSHQDRLPVTGLRQPIRTERFFVECDRFRPSAKDIHTFSFLVELRRSYPYLNIPGAEGPTRGTSGCAGARCGSPDLPPGISSLDRSNGPAQPDCSGPQRLPGPASKRCSSLTTR